MASVSTRSSSGETSNGCAQPLGFLSHDSSTGVMTHALTAMVSTQMVPMTATFCMSGIGVSTTTIMQPASAITPSMPGLKSWSIAELAAARVVSAPAASSSPNLDTSCTECEMDRAVIRKAMTMTSGSRLKPRSEANPSAQIALVRPASSGSNVPRQVLAIRNRSATRHPIVKRKMCKVSGT